MDSPELTLTTSPHTHKLADIERAAILRILPLAGTLVVAADMAGISRHAFARRMVKHRIPHPDKWRTHVSRALTSAVGANS